MTARAAVADATLIGNPGSLEVDSSPEHIAFKKELCDFLTRELTAGVRERYRDDAEYGRWNVDFLREFRRRLGAHGFIGMGWPAEFGGGGRDVLFEAVFAEEMEYHDAPGLDRSITYLPRAIIAFGSDEQKRFFLPKLRQGELSIFAGYSEPEAGSDLANLSTTAKAEGDQFVLRGQKYYSSHAHFSDYGLVAARTDPTLPRHHGISVFLVDMRVDGVRIGSHKTIAGWTHHSVYFDDVRVPREALLGGLNRGWYVIMGAIDFERLALASPGQVEREWSHLIDYCGGHDLLADESTADDLVSLSIEQEAAREYLYQTAWRQAQGLEPQYETSLALLLKRQAVRRADSLALQLLGPYSTLTHDDPASRLDGDAEYGYLDRLYYTFAAGGFDITKNVIAARGLELPR